MSRPLNKPAPKPRLKFTQEQADTICERIATGSSLRSICADKGMPSLATVFKWLNERPAFAEQYARAREEQAETLADEIVSIADEVEVSAKHDGESIKLGLDATAVARNRLRVDARKWVASKLKPKKYGDRTTLAGDPDAPLTGLTDEQINAKLAAYGVKVDG